MPFEYECFDWAYSIEATCHALKLEGVYSDQEGCAFCLSESVT
ncbi:putative 24-methylenesterol C-methyltransferase [Helianthus anomalus]